MEIHSDTKNTLLKRREVKGAIQAETNPGFEQVKQALAKVSKSDAENIAIKYLKNNYGSDEFLVEAFIYDSKEHKDSIEPKPKAKKGQGSQ
jgi:ribosomal protein S24E